MRKRIEVSTFSDIYEELDAELRKRKNEQPQQWANSSIFPGDAYIYVRELELSPAGYTAELTNRTFPTSTTVGNLITIDGGPPPDDAFLGMVLKEFDTLGMTTINYILKTPDFKQSLFFPHFSTPTAQNPRGGKFASWTYEPQKTPEKKDTGRQFLVLFYFPYTFTRIDFVPSLIALDERMHPLKADGLSGLDILKQHKEIKEEYYGLMELSTPIIALHEVLAAKGRPLGAAGIYELKISKNIPDPRKALSIFMHSFLAGAALAYLLYLYFASHIMHKKTEE